MDRKELIQIRYQLLSKELEDFKPAQVVAVSKKVSLEDIRFAYNANLREFGENRVDELIEKSTKLYPECPDISWHFIGNLQRKKVKKLFSVKGLSHIHSVDTKEILEELYKNEDILETPISFFLQVNTSGEKEKSGFQTYDQLAQITNMVMNKSSEKLKLAGFMTMSKIRTNDFEQDAKACFRRLKDFKRQIEKDFDVRNLRLSMGMSADYRIALQEGTDLIRVGSYFFKEDH